MIAAAWIPHRVLGSRSYWWCGRSSLRFSRAMRRRQLVQRVSRNAGRARSRTSAWALSAFYFLTFGGFVAFSIYLPTLLRDQFGRRPADAGFRTAGFVVLATLCDRWVDGSRTGSAAREFFRGFFRLSLLRIAAWRPSMLPFTVGALGCAALLGIGNGAVFKLVPRYFPPSGNRNRTGRRDGWNGRIFPAFAARHISRPLGVVWPGFLLLSAVACFSGGERRVFLPREEAWQQSFLPELTRTADRSVPAPGPRC